MNQYANFRMISRAWMTICTALVALLLSPANATEATKAGNWPGSPFSNQWLSDLPTCEIEGRNWFNAAVNTQCDFGPEVITSSTISGGVVERHRWHAQNNCGGYYSCFAYTCDANYKWNDVEKECDLAESYVLEPSDQVSPSCDETNPCNPANGNKSQRETDYARAAGIEFERYYNSNGAYNTGPGMAAGWRHTYLRRLDEEPDRKTTILVADPARQSTQYDSASGACTSGWNDIKATVYAGDLSAATATFVGGNVCKIESGGLGVAYFPVRAGGGWSVFTPPAGIRTITRPNGSSYKFELVGGNWVNQLNPALKLVLIGSNWVFTDADDTQETFDSTGKLTAITYRGGQAEILEYDLTAAQGGDDDALTLDKVTGPFGHAITFGYGVNSRLSTVNTPDGAIQYGYDLNDNLVSVTYPDATVRQYVYEDTALVNHLTGIIDENNDRFATWAYDSTGQAILSEHAGGKERVQLAYNANGTTTLTMANGAVRTYTFSTEQGERRLTSLTGDVCSTCPGGNIKERSYDSNGFVSELTDWSNNVTKASRNAVGLVETLTEAFGEAEQRVTTTQWHANYRVPTKITSSQNVTDLTYDSNGNVLSVTVSGGGDSRAWALTYNSNGQPLTINGPRTDVADVTTLDYHTCATGNECGQLQSVTNALGHVATYDSYDSAGRLTQMTEPNGVVTSYTYSLRGQPVTITQTPTVGVARVTSLAYDDVGQLETFTLPNGVVLTYAYEAAHYLSSVTDSLGNYVSYSYDVMGNPSNRETYDPSDNLKRSIEFTHDINYRLDTITSGGFTTDLDFDLVGNLSSETDPDNAVTQHLYDALNRLDSTTDALNGVTDYGYDSNDNLTQVVAPSGATTDYVYDALDNLDTETSADRGLSAYTHDDSGNVLTKTDARGVTATYGYDELNRLVTVSYPNPVENVTYTYDHATSNGVGRLRSITDQSGITTYAYDEFGNVASDQRTISGVTYTTTYQYDDANNVSSITYPSGRVVDYVRDVAGQITQVTSTKNSVTKTLLSNATYDPFGPVSELTYGNGLDFDYQYSLDSRVTSLASTAIVDKTFGYDAAGNIAEISDSLGSTLTQNFSYDELARLTEDKALTSNPLAYWRLGETSGSNAADISGNNYDATYVGTVVLGEPALVADTDTAMGIAVAGGGYVDGPTLTGTTVTGVEAWFQTVSVANHRDVINLHNTNTDRILVSHRTNGTIGIWKDMAGVVLASDAVVSTGEPHHVAVWYEVAANRTYMMIDGVTQQNTYAGNLLAVTNPKVDVAAYRYHSAVYKRFLGVIDEVAIYDGIVSSSTFANRTAPISLVTPIYAGFKYGYDANGNRISSDDSTTVVALGYQALSNQLTSIDSVVIQNDLAGNRTHDQGGVRTFAYNNANRLVEVFSNGISIATYSHNAFGQRSKKSANSANTVYLYDIYGHLIAEHDDTGVPVRDYVWDDELPIAQIDQGEVFVYLHLDHLGTPRLATDDSQTVVWRWDSDAFGPTPAEEDPDGNGTTVTVNLRFPGQYYDQESGLHYNYFRTYDPSTGRYLESDPIGLAGGLNTYGYVGANPLMYYDPYGLFGMDDIFGAVYNATGGWSPSQGLVNGAAGFGDGAYSAITLGLGDLQDVRDILDIDGGVDPCSDAYRGFKVAGTLVGAGALGGAVGSKSFAPGGWLNSNRYFRVGFGRRGGRETFRMAGQWLQRMTGKSKKDLWTGGPL